MINVFIGFDPNESVAFYVLAHSIQSRCSLPVSITPINLQHLKDIFARPAHNLQSTEFAFSRFLVPYLSEYRGWSLFMDCDMLVLDDIAKIWQLADEDYAVKVVKHVHIPKEKTKFFGQTQTTYEKKNWSSVMFFNNARCSMLTPKYVSQASGLELHQFKWLEGETQIGELPKAWNHLVGYDKFTENVSNVHFTVGGPYFKDYENCEYSRHWFSEREKMLNVT
jgi:lipopolysaccharide biosynthesis glycosyltransferase